MKNVADFLRENAERFPHKPALVSAGTGDRWNSITYQALNQQVDGYAKGFAKRGVKRGDRVLFLVKPGFDFYATLFGLFRLGAVPVLVDPGMGLRNVLACIEQIRPKALVAIPLVQIVRLLRPKAFKSVELNVTAGMRLFWGGLTLKQCLDDGSELGIKIRRLVNRNTFEVMLRYYRFCELPQRNLISNRWWYNRMTSRSPKYAE